MASDGGEPSHLHPPCPAADRRCPPVSGLDRPPPSAIVSAPDRRCPAVAVPVRLQLPRGASQGQDTPSPFPS